MRSTKRQPPSLWQPNDPLRHNIAGRNIRLAKLFVGSIPSWSTNVHIAASTANSSQRHGDVEDRLDDLFDAAAADAMGADQVGQQSGQPRADAVSSDVGGDGGAGDFAAAGTGAGVPLVFNDASSHGGQFGDLMPGRLGIVGSGLSRQRRLAMAADRRHDGEDLGKRWGGRRRRNVGGWPSWPPRFLPVGVLTTGVGACGGLAEGGSDELEAFLPSRASS